jgi:uncharacterized protein YgbK (DUF1537 family)
MEALSVHGIKTVLFTRPPAAADLARFPDCRAAGIAGMSRSMSPEWMSENLPAVFESLRELGAPLCHYKVCSTFDSSPRTGNIGRAIEIGRTIFNEHVVPLVAGAPALKRYVLFGNLFATADGITYRIDRHPTMSRHPVTPMDEGDLRIHLARQTDLRSGLVDVLSLAAGRSADEYQRRASEGCQIVLFDTLDTATLVEAGRIIAARARFVAGSSGVEYALLAFWQSQGQLPAPPSMPECSPVDPLLVVSGSCSPGTKRQIEYALANGFTGVPFDTNAFEKARLALRAGKSVVVYSALGEAPECTAGFRRQLGENMGEMTARLAAECRPRRMVIAGGDTSGYCGNALGIEALTMIRPFAPGSPLCRAWSKQSDVDGLEILFKGGQMGGERLFVEVKEGAS